VNTVSENTEVQAATPAVPAAEAQVEATTQVEAVAQATPALAKVAKVTKTGNLIHDIAVEIEELTKVKTLNQAEKLSEDIETNYFRLGGLLKRISSQQWFEGFPTFEAYVLEKFGFAKRKADYLISIYTHLVDKQIPWEKVAHLGWTKLKDLAPVLTVENVDEWVAKAEKCTVAELMAMLKPPAAPGEGTQKTTSDLVPMKFGLQAEQATVVTTALAKAKGEMQTDYDNVALAAICSGYLANSSGVAASAPDMVEVFKGLGYEKVLGIFDQVFPNIDLDVTVKAAPAG
jgi:hypothetical protein